MTVIEYSEQLQEAFLHLAHARQQEEHRRKESDAILDGLSALVGATSSQEVMSALHDTFYKLTGCASCFVMVRRGHVLVEEACGKKLPIYNAFARVLNGGILNAFDVQQIPEWQDDDCGDVSSALHLRLQLPNAEGMLILTSSNREAFPNDVVELVRRMIPFAEQSVAKIESIEQEHAKEVREQRQLMQLVLDYAPVGVWMLNNDNKMKFINRTFCDAVGVTEQRFLAAVHYSSLLPQGVSQQCEASDQKCFEGKELVYSREVIPCVDGKSHTFDVIKVPVFDADNAVNCLIGIAVDVTDKLESEHEKEDMQKQILHTQKLESLGVLAGGIAHDFNNILAAIMGHASLAESKSVRDPLAVQDHLQVIVNASEKAADLCKQMLAYSGKGKFLIQPIHVSVLIQGIINILEVSLNKGVGLKMLLPEHLPMVEADSSQVQQVMMNLITNANEAIGDRNGVVSIKTGAMLADSNYLQQCVCADEATSGHYVYIEVADTGCGMNRETIEKMFDPFFSTKFTGRGLGMSAVLGIVRGHKGALKVYSELGQGTTFRVLFPALSGVINVSVREEERLSAVTNAPAVLIVDDEPVIRDMAILMLNEIGVNQVFTAEDGEEGVRVYKREQEKIGLVLLDLTMPRMDGEETFSQLRRINPHVKVVLSSGYSESDIKDRFMGKGLYGFIQKPYLPGVLQGVVRDVFDEHD